MSEANEHEVVQRMPNHEALVLFEWLNNRAAQGPELPEDGAEQIVLWHIEAQLEKAISNLFDSDYKAAVEQARSTVVNSAVD
jgi:hypothetical protein